MCYYVDLSVVYTLRNNGNTIRIISARTASSKERMMYGKR